MYTYIYTDTLFETKKLLFVFRLRMIESNVLSTSNRACTYAFSNEFAFIKSEIYSCETLI